MTNSPTRPLKVFLCHASADKSAVRKLYRYLRSKGIDPWLDAEKLLPGEDWEVEIPKAIFDSDVFLVCLSKNSVNKEGYVQKEIVFALDKAMEKPEGTIFIVPAKLEECDVPQRLNRYQWVDLYRDGYKRLMLSLNKRALQLGLDIEQVSVSKSIKRAERERIQQEAVVKADLEMIEQALNESTEHIAAPKTHLEFQENSIEEKKSDETPLKQGDTLPQLVVGQDELYAFQKASLSVLLEDKEEKQELSPAIEIPEEQSKKIQKLSISPSASARLSFTIFLIIFIVWGGIKVWNNLLSPSTPLPTRTSEPAVVNISSHTEAPISPTFTKTLQAAQINTPSPTKTLIPPTPILGIGSTMIGKDGMTLLYVLAGEFTMGSDNGRANEMPVHKVYLDAFWIDQTEVTNAMYAKCVVDSACKEPAKKNSYTHPSYYGNAEFDNYPIIYVNWSMAKAYCSWVNRRLPTEAEWEKAALGTDGRTYPWGNDAPNNNLLNYNSIVGDTTEVGKYPNGVSMYSAYDMAGNVWEWVEDWYGETYYTSSPPFNPLGPDSGQYRGLRGGAWDRFSSIVRSAYRYGVRPTNSNVNIGFRCAMSTTP